jgi:FkbM family methyltransferase
MYGLRLLAGDVTPFLHWHTTQGLHGVPADGERFQVWVHRPVKLRKIINAVLAPLGSQLVARRLVATDRLGVDVIRDLNKLRSDNRYRTHLAGKSIDMVFDIGANVGQSAIRFAKAFPNAQVHTFEPVRETFRQLQSNVRQYHNIYAHCHGFGSTAEQRDIYLYAQNVLASCLAETPMMSSAQRQDAETIELRRVDDFCRENGIPRIDLLKVDTEGFDCAVIRGAENLLRERAIDFVYFEFFYVGDDSDRNSGGRLSEIHDYLIPFGYRPVTFYTDFIHWESTAGCYNALYMRW